MKLELFELKQTDDPTNEKRIKELTADIEEIVAVAEPSPAGGSTDPNPKTTDSRTPLYKLVTVISPVFLLTIFSRTKLIFSL